MGTSRDLRWWDIPTYMAGSPKARNRTIRLAIGLAIGIAVGLWLNSRAFSWSELVDGLTGAVAVGLAGGLGWRRGQPQALRVRWPGRSDLGLLAGGTLVIGFGVWCTGWLKAGFLVGLVFGLGALLAAWSRPLKNLMITSPARIHRLDRSRTAIFGLTSGIAVGVGAWFLGSGGGVWVSFNRGRRCWSPALVLRLVSHMDSLAESQADWSSGAVKPWICR